MKYYIKESIVLFEENIDATVSSPEKKGFKILNEYSPIFSKQDA